jgi:hypothetical protein
VEASIKDDGASATDALGFEHLVKGLDTVLNHSKTTFPLAIAVTAPWGAGKSSVMLQLKDLLDKSRETKMPWHSWLMLHVKALVGKKPWGRRSLAIVGAATTKGPIGHEP